MPIRLTGPERGELAAILIEAFPDPGHFRRLLDYRLNRNLAVLAAPGDYNAVMFEVLQKAVAQWWVDALLIAAREENPRDPELAAFAARYGGAVALPEESSLQQIVHSTNSFLDPAMWRTRLAETEARVCRVEIEVQGGMVFGTAFLIGPRTLLTNFHVVEHVIRGIASPSDVAFRFDYKVVNGKAEPGRVYRAASDWLIDSSPYSDFDRAAYTPAASPSGEELDYAVLRLDRRLGELPIGDDATPDAAPRGWVPLPDPPRKPVAQGTMHILQHPNGEPLKLALGGGAVIGMNANDTRVRYTTNTLGGSSGSPCFDQNWELMAVHHAGDPRFPHLSRAEYNQGIPISAVVERLQRGAKLDDVSA